MKNKLIFFQDYLFENLPIDRTDWPLVDVQEKTIDECSDDDFVVNLSFLHQMDRYQEWEELFNNIKNKKVFIIDDLKLVNSEVAEFKDFYLRAYFHNIREHCKEAYIINNK